MDTKGNPATADREGLTGPGSGLMPAHAIVSSMLWVAGYLAIVAAPLAVMVATALPPPAGFWRDFGRGLGYVGAAMMAAQFLLTARFRRVAPAVGIDIVLYLHRYLAVVGCLAVAAHSIFFGVAASSTVPSSMIAGALSLIGLAALLVTSLLRSRLELEYDRWRRVHAGLAVLTMGLMTAHVAGAVPGLASPARSVLCVEIGGLVVGTIAWTHVVRPWQLRRRPYRVTEVRPERGDAWTVAVEPVGHRGFRFTAGQFAWLTLRHSPFAMREHPFSISSAPDASGRLEFTIKELGDFTRTIGRVQPGETAWVDGPYGAFTLGRVDAPGYAFIGGGIGLAPIVSLLRALDARGDRRPLVLVVACSAWERVPFRDPLDALATRLALRVVTVLESPPPAWTGEVGRVDGRLLARHLPPNRRELEYYVCGPGPMIDGVERALHDLGIPRRHCHSELFDLV